MQKFKHLFDYIIKVGKKLSDDNINAYSAQAAFFLLTSMFPFIMLLLSLLQFFPFDMEDLIHAAEAVLPGTIKDFIVPVITEIYSKGTTALISATAVTALWSASTGVNAVGRGLSKIYDNETENWFRLRFQSIFFMLGLIIVIILSLGLFVFGSLFLNKIAIYLPKLPIYALLTSGIRAVTGVCVLTLIFDLIYLFAPRRKSRFGAELPGSFMAAVGWMGFSFLYSFYVNNMANFSIYGSLTAVVLFMLWMYVCFYILFLGAEINRLMQNTRAKQEVKDLINELKDS